MLLSLAGGSASAKASRKRCRAGLTARGGRCDLFALTRGDRVLSSRGSPTNSDDAQCSLASGERPAEFLHTLTGWVEERLCLPRGYRLGARRVHHQQLIADIKTPAIARAEGHLVRRRAETARSRSTTRPAQATSPAACSP